MGTQPRVLGESFPMNTNMTGFRWFSKNLGVFVLWMKDASALEGLIGEDSSILSSRCWPMNCEGKVRGESLVVLQIFILQKLHSNSESLQFHLSSLFLSYQG